MIFKIPTTKRIRAFILCVIVLLMNFVISSTVSAEQIEPDNDLLNYTTQYVSVTEYDYTTGTQRTYTMSYREYTVTSIVDEPTVETRDIINNTWQRVPSSSYDDFPYSAICRYTGDINATAFITGKRVALTAAHVVYDKYDDSWYTTTPYVLPHAPAGVSDSYVRNNGVRVLKAIIPSNYKTYSNPSNDYAILILEEDVGTDNGILPLSASSISVGNSAKVIGYPAEITYLYRLYMHESPGTVTSVSDKYIYYNCDTLGGNSGSPVIRVTTTNGVTKYNVIAIHNQGYPTYNVGHRVDQFLIQAVNTLDNQYS